MVSFARSIPDNPKGGEFELLCPACKGVGTVVATGVACLTCHHLFVEFVAQVVLQAPKATTPTSIKPRILKIPPKKPTT